MDFIKVISVSLFFIKVEVRGTERREETGRPAEKIFRFLVRVNDAVHNILGESPVPAVGKAGSGKILG